MTLFDSMMLDGEDYKVTLKDRARWFFEKVGRLPKEKIVWNLQKVFRKSHASDLDTWGLSEHLAEVIYPKLLQFRKSNLHGYPCNFSSKEDYPEYDELSEERKNEIVGGEFEGWLKTIDEMLFAFEYSLFYNDAPYYKKEIKKYKDFLKKWGYEDPHTTTKPECKHTSFYYKSKKDGGRMSCGDHDVVDLNEWELLGKEEYYRDYDLEQAIYERAQKGYELFGKNFMSLWD
jgi:hypothetical protein